MQPYNQAMITSWLTGSLQHKPRCMGLAPMYRGNVLFSLLFMAYAALKTQPKSAQEFEVTKNEADNLLKKLIPA